MIDIPGRSSIMIIITEARAYTKIKYNIISSFKEIGNIKTAFMNYKLLYYFISQLFTK